MKIQIVIDGSMDALDEAYNALKTLFEGVKVVSVAEVPEGAPKQSELAKALKGESNGNGIIHPEGHINKPRKKPQPRPPHYSKTWDRWKSDGRAVFKLGSNGRYVFDVAKTLKKMGIKIHDVVSTHWRRSDLEHAIKNSLQIGGNIEAVAKEMEAMDSPKTRTSMQSDLLSH